MTTKFTVAVFAVGFSLGLGACTGQVTEDPDSANAAGVGGKPASGGMLGGIKPGESPKGPLGSTPNTPGTVPGTVPPLPPGAETRPPAEGSGLSGGLRLLSRVEYDNTVRDLLGDITKPASTKVHEEIVGTDIPFDNFISVQVIDEPRMTAFEAIAGEIATRAMADAVSRKLVIPCTPSGPSDAACLKMTISSFGRRAFRRPMTDEDVTRYMTLLPFAVEKKDFFVAAGLLVHAILIDPEFLFRVEVGTPVAGTAGLFKLNPYETASRLSYFLRGTTPSDALLALADANKLSTPAEIRSAAMGMTTDAAYKERVQDFHAQWLGYRKLPHDVALNKAMQAETRALVDRAAMGTTAPTPYLDLFSAKDTFVDATLAKQYGLPTQTKAGWVPYGAAPRVGILSHGSVLSASTIDPGDTHIPKRGLYISARLMCRTIPPPPPGIDANAQPPTDSPCKKELHIAKTRGPVCQGCHDQMDPIGFGLENYDPAGQFRTQDSAKCAISGEGALPGVGNFKGADGLANALVASGRIEDCAVRQVFRFAMGRTESPDESTVLEKIVGGMRTNKGNFRDVLLDVVGSSSFGLRLDTSGKGN